MKEKKSDKAGDAAAGHDKPSRPREPDPRSKHAWKGKTIITPGGFKLFL